MPTSPSFVPPRWLRGPWAQTLWANYAPRNGAGRALHAASRPAVIATPDDDRIRAHWNDGPSDDAPVLLVLHGLTGCAQSGQVLGLALKAARAGFAVVRADLRNASGDTPSAGVGHAGRSEDVVALLRHIADRAPGRPVALVGYSLGGNVALKALGEMSAAPSPGLCAAVTISVPIDLSAACSAIDAAGNWLFRRYFVDRLRRTVERRRHAGVDLYQGTNLHGVRSIREFDGRVVAPLCGFTSAEDYYQRCSALRVLGRIRVPTLLIQAVDDPFIPFSSYESARLDANSALRLLRTERGGHAGFWARRGADPDRFWAEHRAIEFCRRQAAREGAPPTTS